MFSRTVPAGALCRPVTASTLPGAPCLRASVPFSGPAVSGVDFLDAAVAWSRDLVDRSDLSHDR
jgi:hypothetical protein